MSRASQRRRSARLGLAYHRGRSEWASRRFVAQRDPSSVRRAFRLAGLDLERGLQPMRAAFADVSRALAGIGRQAKPLAVLVSQADRAWMDEARARSIERHVAALHIRR